MVTEAEATEKVNGVLLNTCKLGVPMRVTIGGTFSGSIAPLHEFVCHKCVMLRSDVEIYITARGMFRQSLVAPRDAVGYIRLVEPSDEV